MSSRHDHGGARRREKLANEEWEGVRMRGGEWHGERRFEGSTKEDKGQRSQQKEDEKGREEEEEEEEEGGGGQGKKDLGEGSEGTGELVEPSREGRRQIGQGRAGKPPPEGMIRGPKEVRGEEERDDAGEAWRGKGKHVFVLTDTGRPVWARHGDEDALAGHMASLQAMAAFAGEGHRDELQSMEVGGVCFAFLRRGPLLLVAASRNGEQPRELWAQLGLVHAQLVTLLTGAMERPLVARPGYDLRPLLEGADPVFQSLCRQCTWEPGTWLRALPVVPLGERARRAAGRILHGAVGLPGIVHALLWAGHGLVAQADARGRRLEARDMLLLMNAVRAQRGRRDAEGLVPVCLPSTTGASAFAYAYAGRVGQDAHLVVVCASPSAFEMAADARERAEEALRASGALGEVDEAAKKGPLGVPVPRSVAEEGTRGVPSFVASPLWHFIYRRSSPEQYVAPKAQPPLHGRAEQKEVLRAFRRLHADVHADPGRPERVRFEAGERFALLAYSGEGAEVYMCLDPLTRREEAVAMCHKLSSWIRSRSSQLFAPPLPDQSRLFPEKPPDLDSLLSAARRGSL